MQFGCVFVIDSNVGGAESLDETANQVEDLGLVIRRQKTRELSPQKL